VAIVIGHNHPSGEPSPSQEDEKVSKAIKEAETILGIRLLDHLSLWAARNPPKRSSIPGRTRRDDGNRQSAIGRHARCDWGECCPEDAAANEAALGEELRIFSVYTDRNSIKFWIITEA
jgi:hypothetical protein